MWLNIHIKRKHTNLKNETYTKECDFCEAKLNDESEMKRHTLAIHPKKQNLNVNVHHGKCHSEDFECGMCDYKAKDLKI